MLIASSKNLSARSGLPCNKRRVAEHAERHVEQDRRTLGAVSCREGRDVVIEFEVGRVILAVAVAVEQCHRIGCALREPVAVVVQVGAGEADAADGRGRRSGGGALVPVVVSALLAP